ncbi:ABC transporter ATP-binding protein [Candidatus Parcubacteria bacterium]|nr:ABC transporter ATP-binding protein [Patescibacteria group bacterium]MBU4309337.1 ABC transporter ATP-binding protein [Patescibacteria group bacterium]MBU4431833.1 ABC transporter ATP-binding protein [Patescibacteria group bacterium]MBU4577698.1 ABC transporter ATP-binding protein [Patescibacteria group bacterium]MCG2697384.1 ABC transporter ATP-binding protein [Candidatus Parcubacteria bacterium]
MPKITVKNLVKKFKGAKGGEVFALDHVDLEIRNEKYTTLLGPSGCGKTTLLRIIAGLEVPTSGKLYFDNKNVSELSTQARNIGFVFQHFAVFPHMDVWHNVAYGPTVKGLPQEEIDKIVKENLERVGLAHRSEAMPSELSGGMRQRLGLARALASSSGLLLLDEPLSALDAKIGTFLRHELERIARENKITAIHVTHNQIEAMTMSDDIILMKKGKIIQMGSPEELYNHPNSIFAANFIGKCNFLKVERFSSTEVVFDEKYIEVAKTPKNKKLVLGVRPEKIHLRTNGTNNMLSGKIEDIDFLGTMYEYKVNIGDGVIFRSYKRIKEEKIKESFKVGDQVFLLFYPEDVLLFPEPKDLESELRLE